MFYQKLTVIVIASICFFSNLAAQVVPSRVELKGFPMTLHEDGKELTVEEMEELSVYGFDYERFKKVSRRNSVSFICSQAGGLMLGIGGYIYYRKSEQIGLPLCLVSAAISLGGFIYVNKTQKEMSEMITVLKQSSRPGFSFSGTGVMYRF